MVSEFIADCRRIEDWGQEQDAVWQAYIKSRASRGQKMGVDFTWRDLPVVNVDLPSRHKVGVHPAAQDGAHLESQPASQV